MVTLNGRDFYTFEEYQEAKASAAFPAVLAQIKMQIPGTSPVSYYTAEDAIKNRYHGRLLFHFGDDWDYFLSAFTDLANSLAADFTAKTAIISSLLAKLQANVVSSKIENKRADAGYTNFENAYSDGGTISTADAGNANIGTIIQYQNQIKNLFDETIDDFKSLFLAYNPVSEDCGNTSIPTGKKNHSELENLDYSSSGHTGFQPTIADLDNIRSGSAAGATAVQPATLSGYATNVALQQGLAGKQDTISDLAAIRSGSAAGATAVQPATLSGYATNVALQQGLAGKQDTISDLAAIRSGASAGATAVQPITLFAAIENAKELFKCTYGTTTYNQVELALNDGKIPYVVYNGAVYLFTSPLRNAFNFAFMNGQFLYVITVMAGNSWSTSSIQLSTNIELQQGLAGKQGTISDLAAIRSGATAGATAVQPSALSSYATNAALQQGLATREAVGACYTKSEADALIGAKSVVSGENDGTNWTALTVNGVRKTIPVGGSGGVTLYKHTVTFNMNTGSPRWKFITTSSTPITTTLTFVNAINNAVAFLQREVYIEEEYGYLTTELIGEAYSSSNKIEWGFGWIDEVNGYQSSFYREDTVSNFQDTVEVLQ